MHNPYVASTLSIILFSTSNRWQSLECLILMISDCQTTLYNVQREVDSGLIWLSIVLSNQINVQHHFYMSD